ncbi:MAG: hypothetical protein HY785_18085 [Oscillatoriophycideae cyanobacterium NC_groundwater_1537_Pr4_S-0.65um_50_18]|nr:hypothetical protein [Oscillatoriophycideae cyanobacterium NC_groundwater_1537_Pr4_S-0.65um_50_18]
MGNQPVRRQERSSRRYPRDFAKNQQAAPPSQSLSSQALHGQTLHGQISRSQTFADLRRQQLIKLLQWVKRYPLLLLLAAWAILMLMAGAAIMDMMSLGAAKPPANPVAIADPAMSPQTPALSHSPLQKAPQLPEQKSPGQSSLPLISLVAIAMSCAMGCVLILQCLKPRRQPERSSSSVFSKPGSSPKSRVTGRTANARVRQGSQTRATSEPTISVVPSDISQPLDWDEPSLADSVDLRQQRPLSHWL